MSTDPFVEQLTSVCRSARTKAKWVIVPTHAIGRTLGERLALEGVEWVNLRFITPFSLALQAAAPHLLQLGFDPLPEGLGPSLAMRLLLERPEDVPGYFRPLADQPRMGKALWRTLTELRLAGITGAGLPSTAFQDERKHAELQALLDAYEKHLAAKHQADSADVYRAAVTHVSNTPLGPADIVIEAAGLGAVPPLVRSFLDALPGTRMACAVAHVANLEPPRRLRRTSARTTSPTTAVGKLAFLLAPGDVPAALRAQRLELFHAAGREAEVEGVLRRVLSASSAIAVDAVEVACAAPDAAPLFWEKAQRLGVPITVAEGVPVTAAKPARALLRLCDWIDSGFTANRLRRLLQSGDLRGEFPDGGGGGRAARLLAKSGATWGRATYAQSLEALAGRNRATAEHDEEREAEARKDLLAKAEQAEFLSGWIRDVLARVPQGDDEGHVELSGVVRGLSSLLEDHAAVSSALDGAALAAIRDTLASLLALGDFRCPMRHALVLVRDAVEGLAVGGSRPRPGHLHVSSLASAGYAGRPLTFIVGLQESGVFPSLLEDPVLLDSERAAISDALATSHDRVAEAVHAVVSRLASLEVPADPEEGHVCLSYSCRDLRDGRETAPSWLMLQAVRLQAGNSNLTYEQLREELGTPETLVPRGRGEALTESGWWLASLKVAGGHAADAVMEAFPSLAAGRRAEEARRSKEFTEWDGFVPAARALLDPRVSRKPASVTRLEALVRCPYRYFVEHGLGLEVVDEDPDRDEWLDALQRGSALHDVFASLCREGRAAGRRIQSSDAARARQLAGEKLAELRAECPPPSEVVFDRERADFLRDVELFVEFESDRGQSEPVAFEVAFGQGGAASDADEEPLAQSEPVRILLGNGEHFLLKGRIDRIDRLPDGSYEVIDYKTGKFDRAKWQGTFGRGAMLQHALYGVAAATLLRRIDPEPRIAGAAYEFPSARGGGERVAMPPASYAALVNVLSDLFDVMADGAFVPTHQKKECEWCDFSGACGMPWAQGKAKLENEENEALDAYRRLRSHD